MFPLRLFFVMVVSTMSRYVTIVQLSRSNWMMVSKSSFWWSSSRMSSAAPVEALQFNSVKTGGTVKGVEYDCACPKCLWLCSLSKIESLFGGLLSSSQLLSLDFSVHYCLGHGNPWWAMRLEPGCWRYYVFALLSPVKLSGFCRLHCASWSLESAKWFRLSAFVEVPQRHWQLD